ncbi:hypothetical protein [Phenylobacterium sp.]|uniref:hypothetical protein n=1 Tax=Phenylobacterium sp. TaxID=1871053 RepID=UPI002F920925
MIAAPGSTLWLLRHELRLMWRRQFSRRNRKWARLGLWLSALPPLLLLGAVGVPLGFVLRKVDVTAFPAAGAVVAVSLVAVFTLMLSQTLAAAVDALYERNDLDLLFSSPFPSRHVMSVRFLGVALGVFGTFAYFVGGPLVGIAVMGHPEWLAALVVLLALALGAAGVGLLLSAGLFRLLGPRRTRTVAQVMAALIGAAFFIATQLRTLLGEAGSESFYAMVARRAADPAVRALPGLDWPLRAAAGDPLPLAALLAGGLALFAAANAWLGPRFAADAAAAAGAGAGGRTRRAGLAGAFAEGVYAATLRKELRLLARDPALITQVLLRVLYLLPLGFLLLREAGQENRLAIPGAAAGLVLMAGQVAGSLAWITVSAEDAPDLLKSAPAAEGQVGRGKLAAAVLPVAVLLAPFLLPLIVLEPVAGLSATLGSAACVVASALMHLWWQTPGKRSEFRRRGGGNWVVALGGLFLGMLLGAATALFAMGWPWAGWGVLPALLSLGAVLLFRELAGMRRRSMG